MDIDLLRTFLEVNKTRHFARAADNLFVTSAAVSARVKQLEGQLGVPLFVRHRGDMQLTSDGEKLVPFAETMITTWSRAVQEVSLTSEKDSRLYIGATTSMWMLAMQQQLQHILETRSDLALHAEGHSNDELGRRLADRTLDLVLLPDPVGQPGIQSEKVGELHLVLASSEVQSQADALSHRYIYVDWGTAFANWHASRVGDQALSYLQVNFAGIAINLIEEKGGSAYLPVSVVEPASDLKRVTGAPTFRRSIYACYRKANDRLDIIEAVVADLCGISV